MSIQALLEGSDNIFLRVIKEDVGKQETLCSWIRSLSDKKMFIISPHKIYTQITYIYYICR